MDKKTLNVVLGVVAREARRKSGQSMSQVARQVGCNKQNVSHLELGENLWSVHRWVLYARSVHASPTALLRTALSRIEGKTPTKPDSHAENPQADPPRRAP